LILKVIYIIMLLNEFSNNVNVKNIENKNFNYLFFCKFRFESFVIKIIS
jgi:hypothetical protein